jgi:hypothetical protein
MITERIGDYLRANPSTSSLNEHTEMPTHLLLADREEERGPLSPWYPDNSIQFQPYDARLHVLGSEELAELQAEFLTAGTDILFRLLEQARHGTDSKQLLCLGLMIAAPHTLAPPLRRSFMSYRSHAEGFLSQSADPAGTRAIFENEYRRLGSDLVARAQAAIATLEDPEHPQPVPFVREWATLINEYTERALPLIEADQVYQATPAPDPNGPSMPAYLGPLFADREYRERILDSTRFRRHRLGLNWTYQQLNRLGITPFQRMRACYLTAKTLEDVYDMRVEDLVRNFLDHRQLTSPR